MNYFITAIGTDSGKTLISAIIVEALKADYWKPIQSGNPGDTETVKSLVSNASSKYHQERHLLNTPASPHASAKIDGVKIQVSDFSLPKTMNDLVVEGAGGIMVPINDEDYVIDIAARLEMPIILVANLYLGSINHTLLSLQYLENRNLAVEGVIFNGPVNEESQQIIKAKCRWPILLHVPQEVEVNQSMVRKYAVELKQRWKRAS